MNSQSIRSPDTLIKSTSSLAFALLAVLPGCQVGAFNQAGSGRMNSSPIAIGAGMDHGNGGASRAERMQICGYDEATVPVSVLADMGNSGAMDPTWKWPAGLVAQRVVKNFPNSQYAGSGSLGSGVPAVQIAGFLAGPADPAQQNLDEWDTLQPRVNLQFKEIENGTSVFPRTPAAALAYRSTSFTQPQYCLTSIAMAGSSVWLTYFYPNRTSVLVRRLINYKNLSTYRCQAWHHEANGMPQDEQWSALLMQVCGSFTVAESPATEAARPRR
jgi:hypothetical protein